MAKKLKVELDVDTSKAKHKVQQDLAGSVEAAASGPAGAALPTRELKDLGQSARDAGMHLSRSGRMFAGLATGLARSATAGGGGSPAANAAINGISSVAAGAAMGGLPGAIGAAVVSAISGLLDADVARSAKMESDAKVKSDNLDSMKAWEEARKRTLEFKETLESLNNVETDLTDRQRMLADEIRKREEADAQLAKEMIRESGDASAFQRAAAKRQTNAAELDRLRDMSKELGKSTPSAREGFNAPDALSRVGGGFAGQSYMTDRAQRTFDEQLAALKSIDSKTKAGGATWQ